MTRRVEVQRWPAVPTAPKKIDCVAIFRSAVGQTMSALLPPSSMMSSQPAMDCFRHVQTIATDPVAEINGIRASSANFWPTLFRSPISKLKIAGSAPLSRQTRSAIFVTAIAVNGVFSDASKCRVTTDRGQRRVPRPDRDGKLNAVITATSPSGCHCSINR